ncbi:MerR family DNA-binding transcriptional regulator [Rhodococcus hoagii]|nr:MerR family DNA-binding transcriptional regulator [Prescottella equi]
MSPLMTVGEFALATGLSAKALRFYDERGLLAPRRRRRPLRLPPLRAPPDPDGRADPRPAGGRPHGRRRPVRPRGPGLPAGAARDARGRAATPPRPRGPRARARGRRCLRGPGSRRRRRPRPSRPVAERTVGPTPWAGVVQRVALDEAGEESTTERANAAFATLFQALAEAGSAPAGPLWTALRPVPGAADVVETVLAVR